MENIEEKERINLRELAISPEEVEKMKKENEERTVMPYFDRIIGKTTQAIGLIEELSKTYDEILFKQKQISDMQEFKMQLMYVYITGLEEMLKKYEEYTGISV